MKRVVRSERPWYKPAMELLRRVKVKKVLDLGCGLCEFSSKLKNKGYDVTSCDGSSSYVKNAIGMGFKAKVADFDKKLPFKAGSFDLVNTLEVIEHLQKAEEYLDEINRILKKNGYLLISTPNFSFIGVRLKCLLGGVPPDEGYHFRYLNSVKLQKILKDAGFKILAKNSISFFPTYLLSKSKKPMVLRVKFLENLFASKLIYLCKKVR